MNSKRLALLFIFKLGCIATTDWFNAHRVTIGLVLLWLACMPTQTALTVVKASNPMPRYFEGYLPIPGPRPEDCIAVPLANPKPQDTVGYHLDITT